MKPLQDLPALEGPVFLTFRALAEYLGYRGPNAAISAHKFADRHGLRRYWRSAKVSMVRRADVDAVVSGEHVA